MATSGTVGNTVINTSKLLEKAVRRCGLLPQAITPEVVSTAQEDMFMLLMGLSNRGLNLWCVDRQLVGLTAGKKTYVLPAGTTDVLNLLFCTPSRADYSLVVAGTTATAASVGSITVTRCGVKFAVLPTVAPVLEISVDGVTWVAAKTLQLNSDTEVGVYAWYDLDPSITGMHFRVSTIAPGAVDDVLLATEVREVVVTPFNRDDYASQPNKNTASNTSLNYWFEKLVEPQITLWPVPTDAARHLCLFRYRQLQDIGTLTQEIEIPLRWYEAVSWQLAARLAFELPGVDPGRRAEVVQMARSMTIEVEGGETDNAPTFFAPNIGVYTR